MPHLRHLPLNWYQTSLEVLEDKSYTIYVTTHGEVRPDAVNIRINGKELLLQQENNSV